MSTLVPGASLAASALSTSSSFLGSFGPVLTIVLGLGVFVAVLGVVTHLWRG